MDELRVVKSAKFIDVKDKQGYCFKMKIKDRGLAAMGPSCIQIYDQETLTVKDTLEATFGSLTDIAFFPGSRSVIHGSTSKGLVTMWDIRSSNEIFHLKSSERSLFSTASSENLIVAGGKTTVHFFEARTREPLAEIQDMHTGSIIENLHFHPDFRNTKLLSVGDEGVVNVFNLQVPDVDDSLEDCISLENPPSRTGFVGASNQFFYSIPYAPLLELHSTAEVKDFDRTTFTNFTKDFGVNYLINCWFNKATSRVRITAGHRSGRMRILEISGDLRIGETLQTVGAAAHVDMIRDIIWLNPDTAISCAEDAKICIWKTNVTDEKGDDG